MLQAEKEAIECRIKGYNEQIIIKQKELDYLNGNKLFISPLNLVELNYLQIFIKSI